MRRRRKGRGPLLKYVALIGLAIFMCTQIGWSYQRHRNTFPFASNRDRPCGSWHRSSSMKIRTSVRSSSLSSMKIT